MRFDPHVHHRRSIRLRAYDYAQAGAYFVTLCAYGREYLFGEVEDGNMRLNEFGQFVVQSWLWLAEQYPYVELDEWVRMPNHLHGVIVIHDDVGRETEGGSRTEGSSRTAPTKGSVPTHPPKRKPLGRLIGAFKTVSTKQLNVLNQTEGVPFWQRDFYEHVVRNEADLERIRAYIANNPANWAQDREHPAQFLGTPPIS